MPLPAAPPSTLLQIYTEFGAPVGTLLTAMVRGGLYVPNTAANVAVPLAPPITLLDFLGATAAPVNHTTTVSPSPVYGAAQRPANISTSCTATPANGAGPFTFAWAWEANGVGIILSGTTTAICGQGSSTSTAGAGTIFYGGTLRCTVTDTGNANFQTVTDVLVNHEHAGSA